ARPLLILFDLVVLLVANHLLLGVIHPVCDLRVCLNKLAVAFVEFGALASWIYNIIDKGNRVARDRFLVRRVLATAHDRSYFQVSITTARRDCCPDERRGLGGVVFVLLLRQ